MEYNFREIEKKWQQHWKDTNAYKVSNDFSRPKCYVLDMFPYPSGAGLHVGHPLGYIASDIYSRYKRLKGFNVLHPMGFDAFGLPAEQYAIEHGIHPAVSTATNITNFKKQLDNIGFCYDWDREVNTSEPRYYKWTQWIFLQLFKSWYNRQTNKAEPIDGLIKIFETEGNLNHTCPGDNSIQFTSSQWKNHSEKEQQDILMHYRIAYCGHGEVNWCEALGTVLANDEVVNGVSERGGHPVVKKKLRQWYLRITEYADRLLQGLETVDFSEAMKEMQSNWIGKSSGAEIDFAVSVDGQQSTVNRLRVYTTRPDTIFGVDFMVIAPEHELAEQITTDEQKQAVEDYITYVKSRSERERMAEKKISGVFTGSYAINPFSGREIPIWISEYVLAGYGTGAIMAVPCGDERDHKFAKHFNIPITNIIGDAYNGEEANTTKEAKLSNSDFLNGMLMRDAIEKVISKLEESGIGERKTNYKMRDAAFSRQRYWGEPFPIVWKNGIAYPLDENELPLELPKVDSYSPGPEGEGPLANIKEWVLIPDPSPQVEKGKVGAANVPKYSVASAEQFENARRMRKEYTEAEDKLWQVLRNNQLGVKFRRQHPIDAYIADFAALQEKLIVEIDGGYHTNDEQKIYDESRTTILKEIGFDVLRFKNEEVLADVFKVKERIREYIQGKRGASTPLSTSGEGQGVRETNTMPGYAGSSWYFLRYMDPHNDETFCDRKISDYWNQVDLYIGGTEHAVGHLLYSRMWTKCLYDLGLIGYDEPYKKLVNQGMITGVSEFIKELRIDKDLIQKYSGFNRHVIFDTNLGETRIDVSYGKGHNHIYVSSDADFSYKIEVSSVFTSTPVEVKSDISEHRADIRFIDQSPEKSVLNIEEWMDAQPVYKGALIICKNGYWKNGSYYDFNHNTLLNKLECRTSPVIEKMSKSKLNTHNPDDLVNKYGADTFRMYEMFLGPVEQSKPWDTKGIEGVHRFLRKLWRLFFDEQKGKLWNEEKATPEELKVLHKTIKKIEEDTERFSFNTAVAAFMVCVNELHDLKCYKKEVLEKVVVLLTPYAPHIAEELWSALGNNGSVLDASFPVFESKFVVESTKEYPVSINGKLRTTINIALDAEQTEVEKIVLANEVVQKWTEGKEIRKFIFVKGKMVNVVV